MWEDNLWEEIPEAASQKRIARLASFVSPELELNFDSLIIRRFKNLKIKNYQLGIVIDINNKILCGFYNDEITDFLPLGEVGKAYEFLDFFTAAPADQIANAKQRLKDFDDRDYNLDIIRNSKRVTDAYLPFADWEWGEEICNTIKKDPDNQKLKQVWINSTNFLEPYKLAELVFNNGDTTVRNYYLIKINDKHEITDKELFNGKSDIIYNVIAKEKTSVFGENDFLDYLRFFCWSIEGDKGKFILPEKMYDMPWNDVPDKKRWEDIRKHLTENNPLKYQEIKDEAIPWDESTDKFKAKATVAYGAHLFSAWFGADNEDGSVRMQKDEPLEADLPLSQVKFNEQANWEIPKQLDRKKFYLERHLELEKNSLINEKEFLNELTQHKVVFGRKIMEHLVITECNENNNAVDSNNTLRIENCWFNDTVCLDNRPTGVSIQFVNCVFAKKFSGKEIFQNNSIEFKDCFFHNQETYFIEETDGTYLTRSRYKNQGIVVDFENYRTEGNLIFKNCRFMGEVIAKTMKISGNLFFESCLIAHKHQPDLPVLTTLDNVSIIPNKFDNIIIIDGQKHMPVNNLFEESPILNIDNSFIKGNLEFCNKAGKTFYDPNSACSMLIGRFSAQGIEVKGATSFLGALIAGDLNANNSIFHQDVRFCGEGWMWNVSQFRHCSLGAGTDGLKMENCQITGSLSFNNANIESDIRLQAIHIEQHIDLMALKAKSINLDFSVVKGRLQAFCDLRHYKYYSKTPFIEREVLNVKDDLSFSSATINEIHLEGIKVGESVIANTGKFETFAITIGSGIDIDPNFITPLKFVHSRLRSLQLDSVTVTGSVDITGIHLQKYTDTNALGIDMGPTDDDQKKEDEIRNKTNNASCVIRASKIGGDLKFFEYNRFRVDTGNTTYLEPKDFPTLINWGDLNLEANTIGGFIDLKNTELTEGDIFINDTSVKLNIDANNFHKRHIPTKLEDAKESSGIFKPSNLPENEQRNAGQPTTKHIMILGLKTQCKNLHMEKLQTSGDVNLTGLRASEDVNASGSKIKGGMYFITDGEGKPYESQSGREYLGEIAGNLDLTASEINWVNFENKNFYFIQHVVEKLSLAISTANEKIKKTILDVHKILEDVCKKDDIDSLLQQMRDAVKKIEELVEDPEIKTEQVSLKKLYEILDILKKSGIKIIKDAEKNTVSKDKEARIKLERGKFNKLSILTPTPPINLSNVKVFKWDLGRPGDEAKKYIDILARAHPFEKSTYVDIEMGLRNGSKDEDANEVYREMKHHSRNELTPLGQIGDWFNRFFTGYGTRLYRLLLIWIGVFVYVTFLVMPPQHHRHIDVKPTAGMNYPTVKTIDKDSSEMLSPLEAIRLAGKYCIPLNLPLPSQYEASKNLEVRMDIVFVVCSVLLTLFSVSVTTRLIRGKQ